ncbi:MAG TPA: NeuD/PglB/VioB family sugar acetyltransferase [Sphingomonadaceae bacterium]|nr:NeuD/PglB/VioB family sugar acetyltransferase [Sphingomonadaceae bacterium]
MTRLAIFGYGGMGRELVEMSRDLIKRSRPGCELVFVDDRSSDPVHGIPVLSPADLDPADEICISVGDPRTRRLLAEQCAGRTFFSLFAATAIIAPTAEIGEGAVFCAYTLCNDSARIGRQFQCNYFSYVAHDCVIGDFVSFAPAVRCNGNVHVGDGAYIGSGAVIRHGLPGKPLRIGAGATVGMGAVVTQDVPAGETWVGNPARPIDRGRSQVA